jgi:hypothetical protein
MMEAVAPEYARAERDGLATASIRQVARQARRQDGSPVKFMSCGAMTTR